MPGNINQSNGSEISSSLSCDAPLMVENLLMTIFLVIVLLLTFFGNLLVMAVVFVYERLHRVTNYFIVSLAVADLLVAALSLPFRIHQTMHNGIWCINVATCGVWLVVDAICSCASICNLAAISIDRFIAINSPFRYSELVTKTTAFIMLAVVWGYSALWGLLVLPNWKSPGSPHITISRGSQPNACFKNDPIYYTCAAVSAFFLPLIVIITAYSIIFKVAVTQAKAVAALDPTKNRRKKTTFFREVKATKTIALVIGAFVICWLPLFIILLVSLWDEENSQKFQKNKPEAHQAITYIFISILPPLNSCANPIIYAVFNSNFRSAFLKFLHIPHRVRREFDGSIDIPVTSSRERPSCSTMLTDKSD